MTTATLSRPKTKKVTKPEPGEFSDKDTGDIAAELETCSVKIRETMQIAVDGEKQSLNHAIAAGQWIHQAKTVLKESGIGRWDAWFAEQCSGYSTRSARRYEICYLIQRKALADGQKVYQSIQDCLLADQKTKPAKKRDVAFKAKVASGSDDDISVDDQVEALKNAGCSVDESEGEIEEVSVDVSGASESDSDVQVDLEEDLKDKRAWLKYEAPDLVKALRVVAKAVKDAKDPDIVAALTVIHSYISAR